MRFVVIKTHGQLDCSRSIGCWIDWYTGVPLINQIRGSLLKRGITHQAAREPAPPDAAAARGYRGELNVKVMAVDRKKEAKQGNGENSCTLEVTRFP
jgi:hypothetical protein